MSERIEGYPDNNEKPKYSKEFLNFSKELNEDISLSIDYEMRKPYEKDTLLNEGILILDNYLRKATKAIINGDSPEFFNLEEVLSHFLVAYRINDGYRATYLWRLIKEIGVEPSEIEYITEEIADREKRGEPLKAKEILSKLYQARN